MADCFGTQICGYWYGRQKLPHRFSTCLMFIRIQRCVSESWYERWSCGQIRNEFLILRIAWIFEFSNSVITFESLIIKLHTNIYNYISLGPGSCAEVLGCDQSYADGEYWLYPDLFQATVATKVKVYCHNMASGTPEEFVTSAWTFIHPAF